METRLEDWLTSFSAGQATMSQRGMRWVEAVGRLNAVVAAARLKGVHLVQLADDRGRVLAKASPHPFTALC